MGTAAMTIKEEIAEIKRQTAVIKAATADIKRLSEPPVGILALDLGTCTGWGWASGGQVQYGHRLFNRASGQHHGHQFRAMLNWLLNDAIPGVPGGVQCLAIERIGFSQGKDARDLAGGWRCCCLMAAARLKIPVLEIPPTEWQKYLIGKANKGKEEIGRAHV